MLSPEFRIGKGNITFIFGFGLVWLPAWANLLPGWTKGGPTDLLEFQKIKGIWVGSGVFWVPHPYLNENRSNFLKLLSVRYFTKFHLGKEFHSLKHLKSHWSSLMPGTDRWGIKTAVLGLVQGHRGDEATWGAFSTALKLGTEKAFAYQKGTINKMERQPMKWEKTFANKCLQEI